MGGVAFATVFAAVGQKEAHAARYYGRAEAHRGDDRGLHIGVDVGMVLPVANTALDNAGPSIGVDGIFGFRVPGGPIWVQPELTVGMHNFATGVSCPGAVAGCQTDYAVGRFMVGARLGGRGFFQPQALAHVGWAAGAGNFNGFAYDAGLGFDFKVRHWNFGVIGTFNGMIQDQYMLKWLFIGPEVGLTF